MFSISSLQYIFEPLLLLLLALIIVLALVRARTKRFYFVRHGETLLNAQHIRQGAEGALSPKGREQAQKVGVYLKRFPIERIISSSYPRAKETAAIIGEQLNVPIVSSSLFAERRNPTEIIGKPTNDPAVVGIVDRIDLTYHTDEYRYSDEENFNDLKQRARESLDLLSRQGPREMVIVTHHGFLKMCIAYLLYREQLHAAEFVKLSFFNVSDNAGITICEYNPWEMFSKTRGWRVISYNEQLVETA